MKIELDQHKFYKMGFLWNMVTNFEIKTVDYGQLIITIFHN